MGTKLLRVVLAAMVALLPMQGQLYAAVTVLTSVSVGSQGTLGAVSTLAVNVFNISDDTANTTGLGFNAGAGAGVTTSAQYLKVDFNDNTVGFQAVTIQTDNRDTATNDGDPAADPLYSGIAQGSGLVGNTDKRTTVPLLWTVFDEKVNPPAGAKAGTGYSFQAAINDGEFYTQDKKQGTVTSGTKPHGDPALGASACNDKNKDGTCQLATGEFTDRGNGTAGTANNKEFDMVLWDSTKALNRCNAAKDNFEGIDWDGDCYDGAKPYDAGFASVVFGISGRDASLADATGFIEATGQRFRTTGQSTTDGQVFMYLATDYKGAEAQQYSTNQLTLDLVTIS